MAKRRERQLIKFTGLISEKCDLVNIVDFKKMLFTLQLAFRDQGLCFWYPPHPQIIRESFFLSTDRKNVE